MAKLVKHTVKQSRQAFEVLSQSADTQLKQKFMEQIELAEQLVKQTEHKLPCLSPPAINHAAGDLVLAASDAYQQQT
jgi:hypothetical protein